jgi:8-oxo-dGTP pyrophosphatase MutT (NUDIX family)
MTRLTAVHPWSVLAEEVLSEQSIFSLVRTTARSPDSGREQRYLRLTAPDWVNVIALDSSNRLILVEQYRHGTRTVTLEIPGGAVDRGETPADAAARELEEETGYAPADVVQIGVVEPNPAFLSNCCWTFLATGCFLRDTLETDSSEELVVRLETLDRFTELINDGTIVHALVVAAHDHLQRGRRRGAPWTEALPR